MTQHILDSMDPKQLGYRLQAARRARGFTQQYVADTLGIARTTVTAMEKGERKLQPNELVQLANLYGKEVSDLVGQRKPMESFAIQFRMAAERARTQQPELEQAANEFRTLCEDYIYLEQLCKAPLRQDYPIQYPIEGVSPEEAGQDVASAERNRLGLGEGPILNLREVLENDVGLRIFFIAMPPRVSGMFGYTDEVGGCIAANFSHPEERRRWTLVHEYGHFLTRRFQPEISIEVIHERKPAAERFADAFSGNFLMPATGLRRRFNEMRRARQSLRVADLCLLAHYYFVSVEAMALRMEELRLLPAGSWYRLQEQGFKVREAQAFLELSPHPRDDDLLPLRYQYLAAEAYQRGELTEGELARLLQTDRLQARRMVQRLSQLLPVDLGQRLGKHEAEEDR